MQLQSARSKSLPLIRSIAIGMLLYAVGCGAGDDGKKDKTSDKHGKADATVEKTAQDKAASNNASAAANTSSNSGGAITILKCESNVSQGQMVNFADLSEKLDSAYDYLAKQIQKRAALFNSLDQLLSWSTQPHPLPVSCYAITAQCGHSNNHDVVTIYNAGQRVLTRMWTLEAEIQAQREEIKTLESTLYALIPSGDLNSKKILADKRQQLKHKDLTSQKEALEHLIIQKNKLEVLITKKSNQETNSPSISNSIPPPGINTEKESEPATLNSLFEQITKVISAFQADITRLQNELTADAAAAQTPVAPAVMTCQSSL